MHKLIAVAALSIACTYALSTTVAGSYAWVSGTLATAVTPSNSPQTVTVKVGSTNVPVSNTLVVGATNVQLPIGTPFAVLKAGSTPFAGTYSGTTLETFTDFDTFMRANHRTVPITSAGVLVDSIGFQTPSPATAINLFLPAFTIGTYNFPNGMSESISAPITHFSGTLPSSSTSGSGSATFPTASAPLNLFHFVASGASQLELVGQGAAATVNLAGLQFGSGTTYTLVTLKIANAVP